MPLTPPLTYKTCWSAPGYRDLRFVLVDKTGAEYELHLPPKDVQRIIFECADAAKQINDHPPLDWEQWPSQILWPSIVPWMVGPAGGQRA